MSGMRASNVNTRQKTLRDMLAEIMLRKNKECAMHRRRRQRFWKRLGKQASEPRCGDA